jgi:hypothetical protein
LNAPSQPLYFPVKSGSLPRNDYLGVTIAPDGTPWTALTKLRSDTPDAAGFIQSTGFAGRLVPVADLPRRLLARTKTQRRHAAERRHVDKHHRARPN